MSDFLTSSEKSEIQGVFNDIHDTFARDIYIYILEEEAFIDTDGTHNPLYGNPEEDRQASLTSHIKKARIKYSENAGRVFGLGGTDSQLNISFPNGEIRLKVDSEAYELITKAKKIRVDDRLCELASSPSRPGPFSPNFWTIYLKQVD